MSTQNMLFFCFFLEISKIILLLSQNTLICSTDVSINPNIHPNLSPGIILGLVQPLGSTDFISLPSKKLVGHTDFAKMFVG